MPPAPALPASSERRPPRRLLTENRGSSGPSAPNDSRTKKRCPDETTVLGNGGQNKARWEPIVPCGFASRAAVRRQMQSTHIRLLAARRMGSVFRASWFETRASQASHHEG